MGEFYKALKETFVQSEFNESVTENGAKGYKTTGKKVSDLNYMLASYRSFDKKRIIDDFSEAYAEDPALAITWLFYARDAREGAGERRFFRIAMEYLANENIPVVIQTLDLIAEYGRWDDVFELYGVNSIVDEAILQVIMEQFNKDTDDAGNPLDKVSIMWKWMPSEQASSQKTKALASKIRTGLELTPKQYRKMLSSMRANLRLVESQMSKKEWSEIDYSAVPARANLIYNKAFFRQDEDRRREFIEKAKTGEVKMNAGVLFPHDIVHNMMMHGKDDGLEVLWKNLPRVDLGETIVVADGSGSMLSAIGNTSITALDVANSLAIYFAEQLSGNFKNKYITFSETPQLVNLPEGSLWQKLQIARRHNEVANTNIEAVFQLILETAIRNHMTQEQLPKNILIISDGEFDSMTTSRIEYRDSWRRHEPVNSRLFDEIAKRYEAMTYKIPRLCFWNTSSRTGTIPVIKNELGVALVSGFSPNIAKLVMSNKTDPFEILLETLNSERYKKVREAIGMRAEFDI